MKIFKITCRLLIVLTIYTSITISLKGQSPVSRDTIIVAALEIMTETSYCGLVTIDSTGQPQTRTMNPFPASKDLITWFATSRSSRKVREIRNNPRVSVYYANHMAAKGYVNICGKAEIIDDRELLVKMKREYWNGIPGWQDIFVLIKIVPESLEVINYKHGLNNDPKTFRAPTLRF
ncbi:MAG: pyridoxamine 5'-phosphate oxidase family protein [Bacteroidales bacterium]|nr:pyridoxamine 5'-phosphate oxidase family protein [Bacteroidales bacterium]